MKSKQNPKFYYAGKTFDDKAEWESWINEFNLRTVTEDDFDHHMRMLAREMQANLLWIIPKDVKNFQMRDIMTELLERFIERIYDYHDPNVDKRALRPILTEDPPPP